MLKLIIVLQGAILWFALAAWLEQRENTGRLIRILRNQENPDEWHGPQALVPPRRPHGAPPPARPQR